MRFKVVIRTGEPPYRRCRVEVPVLPGCVSEGDTAEEALANIREAIASYFDATEPPLRSADRVEEVELMVRREEVFDLSHTEGEANELLEFRASPWHRFLMAHGRHETSAFVAITAGLFAALACGALALAPIWMAFLIGYLTTAGFAAFVCTMDL